jgi:nitroimidazol reductase NimA-like FMN-containing flavoprotein (pyridoxamine 5'-phosphate oxidase superfamily)
MSAIQPTPRTTFSRLPSRGSYDRALIDAVLDEGLVCHVGFVADGHPFVIPTIHARVDDRIVFHGALASRMLKAALSVPVCVTVTIVDGLVLARSAFHHSMNYRSVVILGQACELTEEIEKTRALEAIVEHVVPGRLASVRPPSANEVKATRVLALPITEASAKVRSGPPIDDEADHGLTCWAGEIPLRMCAQTPVPDPRLREGTPLPDAVRLYARPIR